MKAALKIHFICFFVVITGGCRSIYTPTTPNTPLFKRGGEFQLESTIFINGLNVKSAYTPFNHMALQINGQYSQAIGHPNPNRNYHKYLEAAVGYYYCFKDNFVMEWYGGYGQGASIFSDGIISNETLLVSAKGRYEKYYLQLNFGSRKLIPNGSLGISVRAGNVRYSYSYANLKYLTNTTSDHYLVEPYYFINLKMNKRLFFAAHLGITIIQGLSNEPYKATMRTSIVNLGVGFKYTLGGDKKST
jgi:hypothetical protein